MKSRYLALALTVICLLAVLASCSGGSGGDKELKQFLEGGVGEWYLHGNREGDTLMIRDDATWELADSSGTVTAKGKLAMSEFDKGVVQYEDSMSNRIYQAIAVKDGLLNYGGSVFVSWNDSAYGLDQFDGKYYLDGDTYSDYFELSDGEWKFYGGSGGGHISTNSGAVTFKAGVLILDGARISGEDPPFATLTLTADGVVSNGGYEYTLHQGDDFDDYADDYADDYDDNAFDEGEEGYYEPQNAGWTVYTYTFFYRDGNSDLESLYFYDDGTVDADSPGFETVEGTYEVADDGSTVTIEMSGSVWEYEISYEGGMQILTDEFGNRYPSEYE